MTENKNQIYSLWRHEKVLASVWKKIQTTFPVPFYSVVLTPTGPRAHEPTSPRAHTHNKPTLHACCRCTRWSRSRPALKAERRGKWRRSFPFCSPPPLGLSIFWMAKLFSFPPLFLCLRLMIELFAIVCESRWSKVRREGKFGKTTADRNSFFLFPSRFPLLLLTIDVRAKRKKTF